MMMIMMDDVLCHVEGSEPCAADQFKETSHQPRDLSLEHLIFHATPNVELSRKSCGLAPSAFDVPCAFLYQPVR